MYIITGISYSLEYSNHTTEPDISASTAYLLEVRIQEEYMDGYMNEWMENNKPFIMYHLRRSGVHRDSVSIQQ